MPSKLLLRLLLLRLLLRVLLLLVLLLLEGVPLLIVPVVVRVSVRVGVILRVRESARLLRKLVWLAEPLRPLLVLVSLR